MVLGNVDGRGLSFSEDQENKNREKVSSERTERHIIAGDLSNEFLELEKDIENGDLSEENAQIAINKLMKSIYEDKDKDKENFYMILSHLKHRGKARLLTQLENGTNIVAFQSPSGDSFSTKNLNDKLGYVTNDDIIVKRKESLASLFSEKLEVLEQEFKQSFFIAKKGVDVNSEDFQKWMKEKMRKLEKEMDKYLLTELFPKQFGLIEKKLERILKKKERYAARGFRDLRRLDIQVSSVSLKENTNEEEHLDKEIVELRLKQEEMKEIMLKLGKSLKVLEDGEILDQENSYKITYGISEVKAKDNDDLPRALVLAESKAICSSQLNRQNKDQYGSKFELSEINETKERIKEIRSELLKVNKIEIPGELTFFLFKQNLDPETNEVYFSLNEDLWIALRKGQLKKDKLGENEQRILILLKEYKDLINSIDYFKPYLAEDLDDRSEGNIIDVLKDRQEIAKKVAVKGQINIKDFKTLTKVLNKDIKDDRFTSENVFHAEALKIKDCSYINLDVIGLGAKLLADYEKKWSLIEKMEDLDEEKLNEIFYTVGDKTTKRMQEVRGITLKILAKYGVENLISDVHGGDELNFAVPSHLVSNDLLMELKKETSSRVVQTVVAESVKFVDSSVSDKEILLKAHKKAQEDGEKAIEYIKKVESQFTSLRQMVQHSALSDVNFTDNQAIFQMQKYGEDAYNTFLLEQESLPEIATAIVRQKKSGEFYLVAGNILEELAMDKFVGGFQGILDKVRELNSLKN